MNCERTNLKFLSLYDKNLVQIENPCSTGIWDTFNEAHFDWLAAKSIRDQGKNLLTRQMFTDFLEELHGDTDAGLATKLAYTVPKGDSR